MKRGVGPIRGGSSIHPTFETAMAMHLVIDVMRQASDTGREVRLAFAIDLEWASSPLTRAFHSGRINPSTDMAGSAVSQAVPKV